MKNILIALMLMIVLVFSYTVPALASINYNLNTANTQMNFDSVVTTTTTKPFWYICNEASWSCIVSYTHKKDVNGNLIPEYDAYSKCASNCYSRTTVNTNYSNYSYTTTTTRPSYTYTTNPSYYYATTTTTRPSYTYTTNPVANFVATTTKPSYTYTTTTKPVVLFNNQINNQISNFVTTTTSPKYVYTTIPDYNSYIPTTTLPSYTYTTNPVARTFIPVTTIPQAINIPSIDYTFKPTTKPSFNIIDQNPIKSIDLRYAKPIIQPSVNILNPNIQNQDLTFKKTSLLASLQLSIDALKNDLMKLQKKDDKKPLQVIEVGVTESKNTGKPIFLIVNQTDGYIKELQTMKPGWDLQFVSSSQFNSPSELKNYLIKYKSEHNLLKAVLIQKNILEQKIATGDRFNESVVSDWYYSHFNDNYDQLPDVIVGRGTPRELYTNLQKPKLNKVSYGQFLPMLSFRRGTHCADGSCAILGKTDPTLWVGKEMSELIRSKGYTSTSLYETEGYQPCEVKPDLSLNTENFMKTIYNTNFIYALSTWEPAYLDKDNYTVATQYDGLKRAIWFDDKNGNGVMTDDEMIIKNLANLSDLSFNYQVIVFLPLLNSYQTKIMKGLSALIYRERTVDNNQWDNLFNIHQSLLATFVEGGTIGEAVYASRYNFAKYTMPDGDVIKPEALKFRLIGDPTLTIKDLYSSSEVDVQPESTSLAKIEIPMNKTEVEFLIKNIGKTDVSYSFDKNKVLEITPITGNIPIGNEVKIKLKMIDVLPITYQSTDKIWSTPKQKSTKIYFKSNAGDKEITVTYWSV